MKDLEKQMVDYDFNVVGKIVVQESPNKEELEKAKELGKILSK